MRLIRNMDRSLTRNKGCRYLVLTLVFIWLVFPWLQTHWSHLILTFLANKVDHGGSLRIACKSSWIVCIIYRIKKTKQNQNQKYCPSEGSLWMKNVKVSSMRRKWMNEEARVAIHRRRLVNWRSTSIIHEKKFDGWKSTCTYLSMRRRWMNEEARGTYPWEEGR